MSPDLYIDLSPGKVQIRVMAFRLRRRSGAVDEVEGSPEIRKREAFPKVVPLEHIPPRQLGFHFFQCLALQRRYTAAAGNAMLFGQLHDRPPVFRFADPQLSQTPEGDHEVGRKAL